MMPENGTGRPVVVGVTRSGSSRPALVWAAKEARLRHLPLEILHSQEWPPGMLRRAASDRPAELWATQFRAAGQAVLDEALREESARVPGLRVSTRLAEGRPAQVLREAADHASMLVLGTRPAGFEQLLSPGGVGPALVGHLPCPLALVRHPEAGAGAGVQEGTGPVVVGIDGSPGAARAARFAFEEAALRGTDLLAVEVLPRSDTAVEGVVEEGSAEISEALAGQGERFPEVKVRHEVLSGRPAIVLTRAATGAQCLVVGSRGRGGFRGMLLGSTGRTLVHSARCPLVVVPAGE
ncbi:universal stress protein [Streptomyces sp. SCUT-3]|nr:universal stress protein [Streptomyces sp. SCUT-3]